MMAPMHCYCPHFYAIKSIEAHSYAACTHSLLIAQVQVECLLIIIIQILALDGRLSRIQCYDGQVEFPLIIIQILAIWEAVESSVLR